MSNEAPETNESTDRTVFESVVDAYFHFTMDQEGMTMQQAITIACVATNRNYNSSMYTRWREKTPQQDVLKFMQQYISHKIIKQIFPSANDAKIKLLTNNLSVPVTDDENRNIAHYFSNPEEMLAEYEAKEAVKKAVAEAAKKEKAEAEIA